MRRMYYVLLAAVSPLVVAGTACAQTTTDSGGVAPSATTTPQTTAQPDVQADAQPVAGDVVVTARRRNESLQDVPISITAISGAALATRGVRDAIDLQYQTPSLTVTSNGPSRSSVSYAIRGQRTQEVQLLTDPPVGAYFAEVNVPRTYGFGTAFYDLQNVQVLKGVQGTLFGRNMTGGAVLVEPNHPDLTGYHAELAGQYGNFNLKDVTGMVNVPIIKDVLGIRVSGRYRDRDGFTTDVSTGRDYDDQHYYTFRVSAELHLDRFTNYVEFDDLHENEHGTALKLVGFSFTDPRTGATSVVGSQLAASPFFPVAAGQPPQNLPAIFNRDVALGHYQVDYGGFGTPGDPLDGTGGVPYNRITNWGITDKATFKAGAVTFKNIFGYRKIDYVNHTDYDGSGAALLAPTQSSRTNDISEEFQMQGTPFGSRLEFTSGAYFFLERGQDGAVQLSFPQLTSIGFASGAPASAAFFLNLPAQAYTQSTIGAGVSRSYAFYAAGTYTLTSDFKLSGGIRYNDDLRRGTVNPFDVNVLGAGPICVFDGFGTFAINQCAHSGTLKNNAITYDGTIQYEPSRNLTAYAAIRHGYRAGGFGLRAEDDATFKPFQPEKVEEYEVGLKNGFELGGGARLRTSAAAFFQNYSNIQTQNSILVGSNIETVTTNIAKRHDYGGEVEANLTLAGGLSANLFYSYVNNKIIAGDNGTFPNQGIPKHQVGGGVTYVHPIERIGNIVANVNASYRSSAPLDEFDAISIQKGYALVNGRVGIDRIGGSIFGAAAFVSNLTNAYYEQGGIYLLSNGPAVNGIVPGGGAGFANASFGEPRTYGFEISAKF